jgi:hypothetical protein
MYEEIKELIQDYRHGKIPQQPQNGQFFSADNLAGVTALARHYSAEPLFGLLGTELKKSETLLGYN